MMLNSGATVGLLSNMPAESAAAYEESLKLLVTTAPALYLVGILERVFAIVLHIALSVIVWFAVKEGKTVLFPVSILLHALVDAVAVLVSKSGIKGATVITEIVTAAFVCAIMFFANWLWKSGTCDEPLKDGRPH